MTLLRWGLALGVLGGGAYALVRWGPLAEPKPAADEAPAPGPVAADDEAAVELEAEAAGRLGIAVVRARAAEWSRTERVYGRIVPNPRASTEIHAAAAGRLRGGTPPWPTLGQHVAGGEVIGHLQIRVSPDVRLDLQNKLSAARLQLQGEEEILKVHTQTVENLRKITDRAILARTELDTALVVQEEAKIQAATARAAVTLWEKSLQEIDDASAEGNTLWSQPIVAPREGTVVDLAVRPGMEVEAGSLLMRIVDFRRPLVRLDLPPEMLRAKAPPAEVAVAIADDPASGRAFDSPGREPNSRGYPARYVGPAPASDATSQRVGLWYEVRLSEGDVEPPAGSEALWRPGLQVQSEFPAGGPPEPAVAVPAAAVLFHEGRALVYVRTAEDLYRRREVRLLRRVGDDWIVAPSSGEDAGGVAEGEEVVGRQAQALLSKEFLRAGGDAD